MSALSQDDFTMARINCSDQRTATTLPIEDQTAYFIAFERFHEFLKIGIPSKEDYEKEAAIYDIAAKKFIDLRSDYIKREAELSA